MSPAQMIQMAVNGKADLNSIAQFLQIQKEWEANEAHKAYHVAMSEFKSNIPVILKIKGVDYNTSKGNVKFSHADLANAVGILTPELSKHGLSHSWKTTQNGTITITCKITHVLGHSEETSLSASADETGSKNSIQSLGSTITYLERYTLFAILGIAAKGQDDDGKKATVLVGKKELMAIRDCLLAKELPESGLLKVLKIESLEELPMPRYMEAMGIIAAKVKS